MNLENHFFISTCIILIKVIFVTRHCRAITGLNYDSQVAKKMKDIEADYGVQLTSIEEEETHKNRRFFLKPTINSTTQESGDDTVNAEAKVYEQVAYASKKQAQKYKKAISKITRKTKTTEKIRDNIGSNEDVAYTTKRGRRPTGNKNKQTTRRFRQRTSTADVPKVEMEPSQKKKWGKGGGHRRPKSSLIIVAVPGDDTINAPDNKLGGIQTVSKKKPRCSTLKPLPALNGSYIPKETLDEDQENAQAIGGIYMANNNNYLPPEPMSNPQHYIDDP